MPTGLSPAKPQQWSYSRALITPEQQGLAQHLRNGWPFWEGTAGSGGTGPIRDYGFNRDDLTQVSTPAWTQTQLGTAMQGDGVADIAAVTGHELVRFSHEVIYIPLTVDGNNAVIMTMAEAPGNSTFDRLLFVRTDSAYGWYIFDGSQKVTASTTLAVGGVAAHLIGTSDGTNIRIYVNGVLEGTTAAGDAFTGYSTPELVIGQGDTPGAQGGTGDVEFMDGEVPLACVYDKVLTANEVALRYRDIWGLFRMDLTVFQQARAPDAVAGLSVIIAAYHNRLQQGIH